MKFEMYKCGCGYREITPGSEPICPDCGKKMSVITDLEEREHFDQKLRGVMGEIISGKLVSPRRHH